MGEKSKNVSLSFQYPDISPMNLQVAELASKPPKIPPWLTGGVILSEGH